MTLDPDVAAMLKDAMRESGLSLQDVVNNALRLGLLHDQPRKAGSKQLPTIDMGQRADLSLDKAMQVADQLEDEGIVRKLSQGR